MLELRTGDYVGRGWWRRVYRHPHNPQLCVKVSRRKQLSDGRRRAREYAEAARLQADGCDFARVPRYYGNQPSNLGWASVWELMCSYDGTIAPSIPQVLHKRLASPRHVRMRLHSMRDWMLANAVLPGDLHPKNCVCRFDRNGDFNIALVDGWDNNELLPVTRWSQKLSQRKVDRRYERMLAKFDELVLEVEQRRDARLEEKPRLRLVA